MRKVIYSEIRKLGSGTVEDKYRYEPVEVGKAVFHQFGSDYEEFENGAGNYSVAIIETPDGRVQGVPVHLIRFLEPQNDA